MSSVLLLSPMADLNPRTQLIGQALLEEGFDVQAICWQRGTDTTNLDEGPIPTKRIEVTGRRRSFINTLILPYVSALFLIDIVKKRPDVIYCPHISLLPVAFAGKFLVGSCLVYDVQEWFALDYENREVTGAKLVSSVIMSLESLLARFADGILTIDSKNDQIRDRYASFTDNIETINNVPELKPRLVKRRRNKEIVFIGTIVEERGVIKLIESIVELRDRIPEATVRFIGPVRDNSQSDIEAYLEETDQVDAVKFDGVVPYDQIHQKLQSACIGAAPYQKTPKFCNSRGNARKLFDYMNAGIPVIGPAFGGIGDLIERHDCGVTVDTTDSNAVAAAIERLLTDEEYASRLGENARRAVESRFNWQNEREKAIRVIQKGLRGSRSQDGDQGNQL